MPSPIFGLVLAGGASTRMQQDKAALTYHGKPQVQWTYELLSELCAATFISVRPDQRDEPTRAALPQIVDRQPGIGPIAGITAALLEHPKAAWLVVACDLPFISTGTLQHLVAHRDPQRVATAYRSAHDSLPEPLCAIWEPAAREPLLAHLAAGKQCPRKFLINSNALLLDLPEARALDNVNTAEEFGAAEQELKKGSRREARGSGQKEKEIPETIRPSANHDSHSAPLARSPSLEPRALPSLRLRIQYYALFREQAGRSEETIDTRAATPAELYSELQARHPFTLAHEQLKVAINADFSDWNAALADGDTVVFIPPVAGG
jgi:molybdopterin-guanine dinucleotide biosynthesis protein A